ncbi:hypothetical protein [Leeuwenhoekiella sp. MAR_2009_132]|uniref:hypothetical protein n=1 Tax=Leeuwenhoekiella sp. MAR_2009_132 TaxID=1392489 RepID=UPI000490037E|nr:hypothetical protein [Leeuwenhoekiella sp. MAR_2009_132]
MINIKYILVTLLLVSFTSCQNYGELTKIGSLTRDLAEVSGIATFSNDSLIYAIADHGNPNSIYGITKTGEIRREIVIKNAPNEDWEDLATDYAGNLYISDTGNNENDRKDQFIYILDNFKNSIKNSDTLSASKIVFTLSDQKEYPPNLRDLNFDIEALIYKDAYLYMFTRNRSRNFDGITKLYKLPAREGAYEAQLIAKYTVCDNLETCAITGAALSPNGKTLILLTSSKVIKFSGFKNDNFFSGYVESIPFGNTSRKEGVTFKNDSTLYVVDEIRAQTGGNLYEFNLY